MADVLDFRNGKSIPAPEDGPVDETLDLIIAARIDENDTFNKAIAVHLIYEFVDQDGNSQWGNFSSRNVKYTDLLWMLEKAKMHVLGGN